MSPETRIGDAEREAAISALGEHYAAGRLTKEEYDERAERAWSARTASVLAPLFADLPQPHGRPVAPARAVATVPAGREHRGFHPPLLPMVLIFVGVAMLTGHAWLFWVLLALFWWSGRSFRAARRRRAWDQVRRDAPGWAQGWQGHGHGHGRRGC